MNNKILRLAAASAAGVCCICAAVCAAYAEGSADLIKSKKGYRPYLEWSAKTNLTLERESVVYVYAEEGETICFGSSANAQDVSSINAIGGQGDIDDSWYTGEAAVGIAVTLPSESDNLKAAEPSSAAYTLVDDGTTITDSSKIYLFRVDKTTGKGYIDSAAEESQAAAGDDTEYKPLSFVAPKTGTYSFRFLSAKHSDKSKDPTPVKYDEEWDQDNSTVAAFDITVSGADNEIKSGRVWADMIFLNAGNNTADIYSVMYILTDDAFSYEVDLNGIMPYGFMFFSNSRGFLWDPNKIYTSAAESEKESFEHYLQSFNHSFYSLVSGGNTGEPADFNDGKVYINYVPETKLDSTHKIFFNEPCSEVIKAYTKHDKLVTQAELNDVEDMDISFIDGKSTGGNDNNGTTGESGNPFKSTEGYGGQFTVDLRKIVTDGNYPEQLTVMIDFSGYSLTSRGTVDNVPELNPDGTWKTLAQGDEKSPAESSNIVTLTNSGVNGIYTFTWGGLDAYGNIVPRGDYTDIVSTYVAHGVAHIPFIDVETSNNGIQVKLINDIYENDDDEKKYTVYYNNTRFSDLFNPATDFTAGKSIGDNKNNSNGVSSKKGDDGKSQALQFGSNAGNATAIDLWTDYYVRVKQNLAIKVTAHDPLYPIVSFVDQDGTANGDNNLDNTHIWYNLPGGTNNKEYSEGIGGSTYGNTISTGFMAEVKNIAPYTVRNSILWTVTIPEPENDNNALYVKNYDGGAVSDAFTKSNKTSVLEDTDGTEVLKGTIYKINDFDDNKTKAVIQLFDNPGTAVTGTGSVLYGIVIDGLYAPGATADIMYVSNYTDGTYNLNTEDTAATQVHSASYEHFKSSSLNPYNTVSTFEEQ